MRRVNSLMVGMLAIAAIAGCYTGAHIDPSGPSTSADGTDPTATVQSDLPCDVAAVLQKSCASCHGTTLKNDAPNRLLDRSDLLAKASTGRTIIEEAVLRMKDAKQPMPPDAQLPDADIAVMQAWLDAGTPAGTCGDSVTPETKSVCTSGVKWDDGDDGDKNMHPGMACITCHENPKQSTKHDGKEEDDGEAPPTFSIAGTIYPTQHEPDDCYGIQYGVQKNKAGRLQVEITDETGVPFTITVDASGNFNAEAKDHPIKGKFNARVIDPVSGKSRAMKDKGTSGDCNSCHTEKGDNDAPGRIQAP